MDSDKGARFHRDQFGSYLIKERKGAIPSATAARGGCFCSVHHANWVITPHSPEDHDISGKTPGEGIAWCLISLIARGTSGDWGHEFGIGHFLVREPQRLAIGTGGLALAPPHLVSATPERRRRVMAQLKEWETGEVSIERDDNISIVNFPGQELAEYAATAFGRLKAEQAELLGSTAKTGRSWRRQ